MAGKPKKANSRKIPKKMKPSQKGAAAKKAALKKSFGPPAKTFEEASDRARKRMDLAAEAENC